GLLCHLELHADLSGNGDRHQRHAVSVFHDAGPTGLYWTDLPDGALVGFVGAQDHAYWGFGPVCLAYRAIIHLVWTGRHCWHHIYPDCLWGAFGYERRHACLFHY